MLGLGPHAGFIVASYAAVILVLAALIAWLWWDGRRHAQRLAELEAQGLKRGTRLTASDASTERRS